MIESATLKFLLCFRDGCGSGIVEIVGDSCGDGLLLVVMVA